MFVADNYGVEEDDFILDDEGESLDDPAFEPELYDDYVIGVDHAPYFEMGDPFLYITYDYYFFWITFFILLFSGHNILMIAYYILGKHMSEQGYVDEEDERDSLKMQAIHDYCVKIFYVLDKIKVRRDFYLLKNYVSLPSLNEDEESFYLYKHFLNVKNVANTSEDNYLSPLLDPLLLYYNNFINDLHLINFSIFLKYRNPSYNILYYNVPIHSLKPNFYEKNMNMSIKYNMDDYEYHLLYKDIRITYNSLLYKKISNKVC